MSELDDDELSVAESNERSCRAHLNITPDGYWDLHIALDDDHEHVISIGFGPDGKRDLLISSIDDEPSFGDGVEELESITHAQWRRWLTKVGFIPKPRRVREN